MAGIDRKTQQIFGGSLSAPGNIAEFGSLAASAPAYSTDPDLIQTSRYLQGWAAAIINAPGGLASPALEDFNGLLYLITRQLAYLFQDGMSEWDANTTYRINSFVKSGGILYLSKTDNNTGHAVTDTNNWQTYASTLNNSKGICKAWVNFDGRTGTILDSFNVSSVSRTATGCYLINFTTPMVNANYAFSGSCGAANGSYTGGDDNYITGGAPGKANAKSTSGFTVFCYDRVDTATQDSQSISIMVFGS